MATGPGGDPDSTPEDPGTSGHRAAAAGAPGRPRRFGDYRILREIGRGGMGIVYEAWQISLARRVALKVLTHGLGDGRRRRRFEREARSAGRLHHTNIVPVFGFGEHEGTPYYVMQCIQGVGLDAVLSRSRRASGRLDATEAATESDLDDPAGPRPRGPSEPSTIRCGGDADPTPPDPDPGPAGGAPARAPWAEDGPARWKWVARLGVQAASGLDYAHSQGVLHRDVKPSNLLLDEGETLWLTDFGLAKLDDHQDLSRSDDVVGTLRYMPPEAFDGAHGRASDVYGLGLTLYELLARRPAFDETDRARLLWQVSQSSPPPLRKLDRRIPLDLATIVHKAIERRPADRYATAADLAADLARFLDDRPILARRSSAAERYWRWARRNPTIAVLGAILTAVLVLATLGSLIAAGRFFEQAETQRRLAEMARRARDEEVASRRVAQGTLRELQAARDEEERTLYDTRASLAGAAWAAGDYGQYRGLLDLMRPTPGRVDRRGWEWRYLAGLDAEARGGASVPGESFVAVAMRPDGSEFATLAPSGVTRIWRTADGRERLTIRAPNAAGRRSDLRVGVLALAYSPDGRRLAAAGGGGAIAILDARTGDRQRLLDDGDVSVLALAWSPDGSKLAAGLAGHALRIWDVDAGTTALSPDERHGGPVAAVAFRPDGKAIASACFRGEIRLWSSFPPEGAARVLAAHEGEARALAFSPDGSRLASGGMDGAVRIWEVATGKPLAVIPAHRGGVLCLAWPVDGSWLASGGNDNAVRLWDPATGRTLHEFLGHSEGVRAISIDRAGGVLVSASTEGTARVWDPRSPSRPRTIRPPASATFAGAVACAAITRDGRLVACGRHDGAVFVWDAATGAPLHQLQAAGPDVRAVAFSPDGLRLAACRGDSRASDGEAVVWSLADERTIATYRGHGAVIDALAFLDDRRVATAGGDDRIHVWDPETGARLMTLEGHDAAVRRLAPDRVGRTLVSSGDDGTIRLWDAATGRAGAVLRAGTKIQALTCSQDGRRVAAAVLDGSILVWDANRPEAPPARLADHAQGVLALAFTPDGRLISGGLDKCVRVWDVDGGRTLLTLRDHGSAVSGLAISRDGSRLVSSSLDHTLKVWDVPPLDAQGPPAPAADADAAR